MPAPDGAAAQRLGQGRRRAAGVSLGTVSNVLNRPDRVSAAHPRAGRAGDGRARLRAQRVRPPAAAGHSRTLAYVMLDATNPFFTDVAQGIEDAAEAADLSLFICNSDNRADREQRHLAHLQRAAGAGHPDHPGRPRGADASTTVAARGTPLVIVDRTRDDDDVLLGRRRRRARWPARGRAPRRPRPHAGSPSSAGRDRSARSATGSPGAQRGLGRRRAAGRRPASRARPTALTVAEGRGAGERLAGLPARAPPDRGVLRQRPARPRPAAAVRSAPGRAVPERPRHRRLRRHRVRRRRRRPAHLGAPAAPASSAARPPSCCSTRRATPTTRTSRSCSPPSWSPAPRPWAEPPHRGMVRPPRVARGPGGG